MKMDLLEKYDLRVPRYTSYPTAPHFGEAVDGEVYRGWLSELQPSLPLSLYFHVPFCDEMCWFCGCYTKIVKRYAPVAEYLEALLAEIDLVASALPGRFRAMHLHWGGGSPTMLRGPDWQRIMDRIRGHFELSPNAEVAVEMDPRTATEEYVGAVAAAGVGRASIGVQDYDPAVQAAIHRFQPWDMTARVIDWLQAAGIRGINMDLIYGLPLQTVEKVQRMVDLTVELRPARIALFGYAHVPWMKSHQKMINEAQLPDTRQRWEQFTAATERLHQSGYVAIGLDHFALPDDSLAVALREGRLHRNFQGYTADPAPVLLGFGASAIGSLPQGYAQNLLPLRTYGQTIHAGRFPVVKGIALGPEDRLRRHVIERLMCDLEVDLGHACSAHGAPADHFSAEMRALEPLAADGIVSVDGLRIRVTEEGRPFVRLAAAAFDSYLDSAQKRHSKAV